MAPKKIFTKEEQEYDKHTNKLLNQDNIRRKQLETISNHHQNDHFNDDDLELLHKFYSSQENKSSWNHSKKDLKKNRDSSHLTLAWGVMKDLAEKQRLNIDETDLFGAYVACQLRKHDAHHQAVLKHRINNLLFDAEIDLFQHYRPQACHPLKKSFSRDYSSNSFIDTTTYPSSQRTVTDFKRNRKQKNIV